MAPPYLYPVPFKFIVRLPGCGEDAPIYLKPTVTNLTKFSEAALISASINAINDAVLSEFINRQQQYFDQLRYEQQQRQQQILQEAAQAKLKIKQPLPKKLYLTEKQLQCLVQRIKQKRLQAVQESSSPSSSSSSSSSSEPKAKLKQYYKTH